MVVFAVARAAASVLFRRFRFSASGDFYSGVQSLLVKRFIAFLGLIIPFRLRVLLDSSAKTFNALQWWAKELVSRLRELAPSGQRESGGGIHAN